MQRTEKLRPLAIGEPERASTPLFIAAVLLAMGIAYLLVLAQPGLVHGIGRLWSWFPKAPPAPNWALPAAAAGVAIGGAALAVLTLSAFVRGVQQHPYAWLAPVLVGFSTLVMTGMAVELPWPGLSARVFALLAAPTLIGGGAVMQMRGGASKVAGALLLSLPLVALLAGHAAMPAGLSALASRLDASAQLFLFVLAVTSLGVGFMAIVTRRAMDSAALLARHMRDQRLYAAEALDRVRESEMRAAEAERRAQLAEHQLRVQFGGRGLSDAEAAEFAALARPGLSGRAIAMVAVLGMVAAGAAVYFGIQRGAARREAAQQALIAERVKEHAGEIDGLRRHFAAQQAALEAQLAAERSKAAEAVAELDRLRGQTQTDKVAAPAEQSAAEPEKKRARPRRAAARRPARKAAPAASAAAEGGEAELDRETRQALRESVDDDPIGGLE